MPQDELKNRPALPVHVKRVAINGGPPVLVRLGALRSSGQTSHSPQKTPVEAHSREMQFSALVFTSPKAMRFRRELEGFDLGGMDDVGSRLARYGKRPHHNHLFRGCRAIIRSSSKRFATANKHHRMSNPGLFNLFL